MKIMLSQINPTVGDLKGNKKLILNELEKARTLSAELVVFPELALSGYPPEDLLQLPDFLEAVSDTFDEIVKHTGQLHVILGLPKFEQGKLYNSAAVISDERVLGFQHKSLLPTYDVFDEHRYFSSAKTFNVWNLGKQKVAVTICEDIWQHSALLTETAYSNDPVNEYIDQNIDFMVTLSSSPYSLGKQSIRFDVCRAVANTLSCPIVFCNQVGGNDSLIFDGHSIALNEKGELIARGKGFEEDAIFVDLSQATSIQPSLSDPLDNLYRALVLGVQDYFFKQGFKKACIGLSGGIDSAIVACIAKEALGEENVLGLLMPSRYSSEGSLNDSLDLAFNLRIASEKVPIESPFDAYLDLLFPEFNPLKPTTAEENIQARIRGMILMAYSNRDGYIVLSTGNKSEMAMGYATLYGDLCGGLGVINDVTKTQVYQLAKWINRDKEIIPAKIITKPPSAELAPGQKDSDTLPDYAIIDTVLNEYIIQHIPPDIISEDHGIPIDVVNDIVRRVHQNEYKRRQSPPGLRVSAKAFSVGRRFPIVQGWR